MNKKSKFFSVVLFLVFLNFASYTYADITPLDGVDFNVPMVNYTNGSWSLGWEFTPKYNVTADKLGFYDDYRNGLTESHKVGLFDMNKNLLRYTIVDNSNPWGVLNDGYFFKWNGIKPIDLIAGEHYVVAAVTGSENYTWNPYDFTEKWATYITERESPGNALIYPENTYGITGIFGPNIGVTPEPSSIILFGIGLSSMFFIKRKNFLKK
ncbi:MAG: PEP-CTERM sorting domain-containing protein [Candidatus Firestonebacteria bacterium]|nr:PEP-CTERM sorting domain-containing protein [Candidatus Firestonebacteria bacterium]